MAETVENETEVRARSEADAPSVRGYELVVVDGPCAGGRVTIEPNEPSRFLVGTSPVTCLKLTDPAVSRRHLALEVSEHGLRLTDLGSTNGTFVNGVRVSEAYLR